MSQLGDVNKIRSYQDSWLESFEIYYNERSKQNQYDITVEATVINTEKKPDNIYRVQSTGAEFDAYAIQGSYYKNDVVLVQIPNGDYKNQKFILGRKSDEENNQLFSFKLPFDDFIGLERLTSEHENISGAYHANLPSVLASSDNTPSRENLLNTPIWKWDNNNQATIGHTRLGIEAEWQVLLSQYLPTRGTYGFRVVLTGMSAATELNNSTAITRTYYFTNKDMYGNTYAFVTPYDQQKVIDITEFLNINTIEIYFFQDFNFADGSNKYIVYEEYLPENILFSNLNVYLGVSAEDAKDETLHLYTYDSLNYEENQDEVNKNIQLAWIHRENNGTFTVIKDTEDFEEYKKYSNSNRIHIYWYRQNYEQLSDTDKWSDEIIEAANNSTDNQNDFHEVVKEWLEEQNPETNYTSIMSRYGGAGWTFIPSATDSFTFTFAPRTNKSKEKVKAVVQYSGTHIASEPKIFYNTRDVEAELEANARNDAAIIQIYRLDEKEVKTSGGTGTERVLTSANSVISFHVYDENNVVIADENGYRFDSKTYYMQVQIKDEDTGGYFQLPIINEENGQQTGYSLTWSVPGQETMITQCRRVTNEDAKHFGIEVDDNSSDEIKNRYSNFYNSTLAFNIQPVFNYRYTNNIVSATVTANGKAHYIEKNLDFNIAEDQGHNVVPIITIEAPTGNTYLNSDGSSNFLIGCRVVYKDGTAFSNPSLLNFSWKCIGADLQKATLNNEDLTFSEWLKQDNKQNTYIVTSYNDIVSQEYSDDIKDKYQNYNGNLILGCIKSDYDSETKTFTITPPIFEVTVRGAADYPITTQRACMICNNSEYKQQRTISVPSAVDFKSDGSMPLYPLNYFEVIDKGAENGPTCEYPTWLIGYGDMDKPLDKQVFKLTSIPVYSDSNSNNKYKLETQGVWYSTDNNYTYIYYYDAKNNTYVAQAIVFNRNYYSSSLVNNWDGLSLSFDEENGAIMSTMIAAGTKDNNNRFTGVMMGDWSTKGDASLDMPGMYGYKNGEQTFGFKTDGTGFIGSATRGRITFDGNEAMISSADGSCYINLDPYDKSKSRNIIGNQGSEENFLYCRTVKDNAQSSNSDWIQGYTSDNDHEYFIVHPKHGVFTTGGISAKYGQIGEWQISEKGLYQKHDPNQGEKEGHYIYLGADQGAIFEDNICVEDRLAVYKNIDKFSSQIDIMQTLQNEIYSLQDEIANIEYLIQSDDNLKLLKDQATIDKIAAFEQNLQEICDCIYPGTLQTLTELKKKIDVLNGSADVTGSIASVVQAIQDAHDSYVHWVGERDKAEANEQEITNQILNIESEYQADLILQNAIIDQYQTDHNRLEMQYTNITSTDASIDGELKAALKVWAQFQLHKRLSEVRSEYSNIIATAADNFITDVYNKVSLQRTLLSSIFLSKNYIFDNSRKVIDEILARTQIDIDEKLWVLVPSSDKVKTSELITQKQYSNLIDTCCDITVKKEPDDDKNIIFQFWITCGPEKKNEKLLLEIPEKNFIGWYKKDDNTGIEDKFSSEDFELNYGNALIKAINDYFNDTGLNNSTPPVTLMKTNINNTFIHAVTKKHLFMALDSSDYLPQKDDDELQSQYDLKLLYYYILPIFIMVSNSSVLHDFLEETLFTVTDENKQKIDLTASEYLLWLCNEAKMHRLEFLEEQTKGSDSEDSYQDLLDDYNKVLDQLNNAVTKMEEYRSIYEQCLLDEIEKRNKLSELQNEIAELNKKIYTYYEGTIYKDTNGNGQYDQDLEEPIIEKIYENKEDFDTLLSLYEQWSELQARLKDYNAQIETLTTSINQIIINQNSGSTSLHSYLEGLNTICSEWIINRILNINNLLPDNKNQDLQNAITILISNLKNIITKTENATENSLLYVTYLNTFLSTDTDEDIIAKWLNILETLRTTEGITPLLSDDKKSLKQNIDIFWDNFIQKYRSENKDEHNSELKYAIYISTQDPSEEGTITVPTFSVDWSGSLYATRGTIGNAWSINEYGLTYEKTYKDSSNQLQNTMIYLGLEEDSIQNNLYQSPGRISQDDPKRWAIFASDTYHQVIEDNIDKSWYQIKFGVALDGSLYSTKGNIGGWNINENSITSGVLNAPGIILDAQNGIIKTQNNGFILDGTSGTLKLAAGLGSNTTVGLLQLAHYTIMGRSTDTKLVYNDNPSITYQSANAGSLMGLTTNYGWAGVNLAGVGISIANNSSLQYTSITLQEDSINYLQFLTTKNNTGAAMATAISNNNRYVTFFYPVNTTNAILGLTDKRWDLFANNIDAQYIEAASVYADSFYQSGSKVATETWVHGTLSSLWAAIRDAQSAAGAASKSGHSQSIVRLQWTGEHNGSGCYRIGLRAYTASGKMVETESMTGALAGDAHSHDITFIESGSTIGATLSTPVQGTGSSTSNFDMAKSAWFKRMESEPINISIHWDGPNEVSVSASLTYDGVTATGSDSSTYSGN